MLWCSLWCCRFLHQHENCWISTTLFCELTDQNCWNIVFFTLYNMNKHYFGNEPIETCCNARAWTKALVSESSIASTAAGGVGKLSALIARHSASTQTRRLLKLTTNILLAPLNSTTGLSVESWRVPFFTWAWKIIKKYYYYMTHQLCVIMRQNYS